MSTGTSRVTRGSREILEVGQELERLSTSKLPLVRDVLRLYFHFLRRFQGKREAAWRTVKEVSKIWDTTKIPRKHNNNAVKDIEKLYEEWRGFQKNRTNPRSKGKCDELTEKFRMKLDVLYDMGKKDAIQFMEKKEEEARNVANEKERQRWQEEKLFYIDQRGPRIGTIAGTYLYLKKKDLVASEKELKRQQKKQQAEKRLEERRIEESRKRKAQEETIGDSNLSSLTTDSSSQTSQDSSTQGAKRGRMDVISPALVEVLDAAMSSTVKNTNINEKTIRTRRSRMRSEAAQAVKDTFKPDEVLTVHWDGKIVPHLTEKKTKQDMQAVIVTGQTTTQLLGCFAVRDGTAKEICTAVVGSLREWQVTEQVKAMSFDTTNANSGFTGGAAVLTEAELKKEMLWLPCRHHVFERVLADVFHAVMGPSTGPEVPMFKNFSSHWEAIDREKYFHYNYWKESRSALSADANDIVNFAKTQIQAGQPRDDYLEFLELSIIFLGGNPERGVRFRPPGPIHSARWMAKAIYCLKMALFRRQLLTLKIITEKEAKGILQISIFIVKVYLQAWFTAPVAIHAPRNDFQFLKELIKYEKVNKVIARSAQNRFGNHLWYLSEVNVGFALFDDRLSHEERKASLQSMQNCDGDADVQRRKFLQLRDVPSMSIVNFFTKTTRIFFEILGLKTSFFEKTVSDWENCKEYCQAKKIVKSLKVTNDHAERAVKLMSDYNNGLTTNEKSFQDLLLHC